MLTRLLSAEHRAALRASGLTEAVIDARGYWTAGPGDVGALSRLGHSAEIVAAGSALILPVHDVYGESLLSIARPDVPRLDTKGRPKKYENPRGAKLSLDVPPGARAALPEAEVPLWITEGQKKADAAMSAGAGCVLAVLGVWNWKGGAFPAWEAVALRGRTVRLAFDSDAPTNPRVNAALRRLKNFLGSRGAHVRVVHLEPGEGGKKVGLDDWLAGGGTLDQLARTSTEDLRTILPAADDHRPELDTTVLHRPVTLEAFRHLAAAGVFKDSSGLVRVERDEGAPVRREVGWREVRALLDRGVRCVRHTDRGAVPTYPPRDLAEMVVSDPAPLLPRLRATATSPTFTADGRFLERPGYDATAGILVDLDWTPRDVPAMPTADDIAQARRWWDEEALVDFPFASPADRTNALAFALSLLTRNMIPGAVPGYSFDAPTPGTGKGLLVRTLSTPVLGPRGCTIAKLAGEEDEIRKSLTAYLFQGRAAVVFDNVARRISSAALCSVLTEPTWDDRTLGKSESVRYPVQAVFAFTGNNISYSDEMARRVVPSRLVAQTARPEDRQGWRHPNLEPWVTEHRADLFWALAVFVRAWQAAGSPVPAVRPLGSYEAWTRIVGGILEVAGYPDFLGNRAEILEAADPDTAAWEAFVAAWWDAHEGRYIGVSELMALAESHGVRVNGDGDRARTASLGMALGRQRDRFFGSWQVKKGEGSRRREWRLTQSMTPSVTYDTSPPGMQRESRSEIREILPLTPSSLGNAPGKQVSQVTLGVISKTEAIALAYRHVAEREEQLEREGIQAEAAA